VGQSRSECEIIFAIIVKYIHSNQIKNPFIHKYKKHCIHTHIHYSFIYSNIRYIHRTHYFVSDEFSLHSCMKEISFSNFSDIWNSLNCYNSTVIPLIKIVRLHYRKSEIFYTNLANVHSITDIPCGQFVNCVPASQCEESLRCSRRAQKKASNKVASLSDQTGWQPN